MIREIVLLGAVVIPVAAGAAAGPTLMVTGTIVAPPRNAAVIAVLDAAGRETGSVRVTEGETVAGYRVTAVEPDRVSFEASGRRFTVRLGGALPAAGTDAASGPIETTASSRTASVVVGPDGVPPGDIRRAEPVLKVLREHPRIHQKLEEVRPLLRRRLEALRAQGVDPHADRRNAAGRPRGSH
jgi:hypothetical protein